MAKPLFMAEPLVMPVAAANMLVRGGRLQYCGRVREASGGLDVTGAGQRLPSAVPRNTGRGGGPPSRHNFGTPAFVYSGRWSTRRAGRRMTPEQDRRISEVVEREQSRLRNFIRRRVPDPRDAEDILQDVFYELAEANRLLMPIAHVTGWLFRVARNRIIDLFRRKKPARLSEAVVGDEGDEVRLDDLLPSPEAGPEALYARSVLLDELEQAIEELPEEQREVFVGHELEGRSFKEMAAETGVSVNTLLSRKRYAVLRLRERLRSIYDGFKKG
jgi:RNA polymerase sigma factor (sigma-70 family)